MCPGKLLGWFYDSSCFLRKSFWNKQRGSNYLSLNRYVLTSRKEQLWLKKATLQSQVTIFMQCREHSCWLNPCLFPFHVCCAMGFSVHTLAILTRHNDCGTWLPTGNTAPWHSLWVTTFVGFFYPQGNTVIAEGRYFSYPALYLADIFLFLLMPRSPIPLYSSVLSIAFTLSSCLAHVFFSPAAFPFFCFHSSILSFHLAGKAL